MRNVEQDRLTEQHHAHPLVEPVVHLLETVDISTYLPVDISTCSSSPVSMVPTPGWMAVAGRGSVKVAWVQQYALKIPPETPCTHAARER